METVIVVLTVAAAFAYVVKRVQGQLTGKSRCSSSRGRCAPVTPECKGRDTHCGQG